MSDSIINKKIEKHIFQHRRKYFFLCKKFKKSFNTLEEAINFKIEYFRINPIKSKEKTESIKQFKIEKYIYKQYNKYIFIIKRIKKSFDTIEDAIKYKEEYLNINGNNRKKYAIVKVKQKLIKNEKQYVKKQKLNKTIIDFDLLVKNTDLKFNEILSEDKNKKAGDIIIIMDKYIQRKGYKYRLIIKNKSLNYFKSFSTFKEAVEERDRVLSNNIIKRTKWGGKDRRIDKVQVVPGIWKLEDGTYFLQTSKNGVKIRKIFNSLHDAKDYKENKVGIELYSNKKDLFEQIKQYTTEQHNWQPIDQLNRYWISQFGYIISYANNGYPKPISPQLSKDGKLYFHFPFKITTKHNLYLHILLASHFIPNPNNYKYVRYIDGNCNNNSLDNLEWSEKPVQKYNQLKHIVVVSTTNNEVIKKYNSINECLRTYSDLSKSNLITLAKNKKVYNNKFIFEIIKTTSDLPKNILLNKYNNTYFIQFTFNKKKYVKYGFKTVEDAREGLKKLKIIALNEK